MSASIITLDAARTLAARDQVQARRAARHDAADDAADMLAAASIVLQNALIAGGVSTGQRARVARGMAIEAARATDRSGMGRYDFTPAQVAFVTALAQAAGEPPAWVAECRAAFATSQPVEGAAS